MANTAVKDANGTTVYLQSTGTGAVGDPYIQVHNIGAGTVNLAGTSPVSGTVTTFSPAITVDNTLSGIATVTGAGTAVQGANNANANGFYLKAHPDNTDTVWVFAWGQTKASGFPLNSGQAIPVQVTNLNTLGFDADVSGEKICYIKM